MGEPSRFAERATEELELSPGTRQALRGVQAELDAVYRKRFVEMAEAINRQAAALERIQTTLDILVRAVAPQFSAGVPPALRVAAEGEAPDLASAVVVADPLGAGFTLTQSNIADALNLSAPMVSELVRAFGLPEDPQFAVKVRGGSKTIVNYRPAAVDRLRALILDPPKKFGQKRQRILERAQKKLGAQPEAQ